MSRPGSQLDRLIVAMRRRLLIADAVRLGGVCLTISAAAALALTLADRFIALSLPWLVVVAVALSGLPIACAIAWRRRSASLSAAVQLDDGLRLKDRLGTAIALNLDDSTNDRGMSRLVREDAERIAAGIDARAAAPIEWPLSWGAALIVGLSCVPLFWYVKPRNIFAGSEPTPEQVAALDARQQAAQAIRQRAEQLRKSDANDEESRQLADSQARQQALDTLDRLARQFDAPPSTKGPDGSTAPGAPEGDAELSSAAHQAMELADRLDQQSQIEREAQKRTINGLSEIDPPAVPGGAEEFARSLKQGDMAAAQQWLDELEKRLEKAPPDEREALAGSLRQTAEQIRRAADRNDQTESTQGDSANQRREDLGLTPEQIKEWTRNPPSVDDIRRALQDQGQDPIDAQRLAEEAQRDLAQQAADDKAEQQLEQTARHVSDLADSIERPLSPPASEASPNAAPPDEPQDQPKSGGHEPPGASTPDAKAAPAPPDNSKGASATPDAPKPPSPEETSGKAGESKDATDQPKPADKPGAKPDDQPAQTGDKDPAGSATTPGETGKPGEAKNAGESTKPGKAPQPGKDGGPQESPAKAPGESPLTNPAAKESHDPGAQPVPRDGDEPPTGATPGTGEPPQGKQGDAASGQGATPEPGTRPGPNTPTADAPGTQGKAEPGAARLAGEPSERQAPGTEVTPSDEPGSDQPGGDQDSGSISDRVKRLRDTLDQIDQSGRSADQGQEISQEMRDAAKDLLDRMSPEEQEELQRWAKANARENSSDETSGGGGGRGPAGSPRSLLDRTLPTQAVANPKLFDYETQDVDLSGKGATPSDRVIAEMYGPDQQRPEGAVDRQPMGAPQMREAAQAIERALAEEAIPPRYRSLIRNWARRMPRDAEPSPTPTPESPRP